MFNQEIYTLYRGDYTKIGKFDFKKTDKYCRVGPGIYLTDSLQVAESYRIKGGHDTNLTTLFDGHAKDRKDAYDKAFFTWLIEMFYRLDRTNYRPAIRKVQDLKNKGKFQLNDILNSGLTKQAVAVVKEIYSEYQDHIQQKRIIAHYVTKIGADAVIRVVHTSSSKVGFITRFDFPKQEFETSVFKIDVHIRDRFFWELIWDNGIPFGYESDCKDSFIKRNSSCFFVNGLPVMGISNSTGIRDYSWSIEKIFKRIREMLAPYGYRGFEYSGGAYIGGCGSHRAFCIWEDSFVNQYKTERFK